MDPFEDDDFGDLNETREERLAYNLETTAELLESWSKKADAPNSLVPTKPCPAIGKPKLMKIPSALQIILDNFTNFEQTIEITEVGRKLKLKKGKGMVSLEKYDLKRKSKVFENCVVAVVHSLSAKGEQLVPRWAHVSCNVVGWLSPILISHNRAGSSTRRQSVHPIYTRGDPHRMRS